jgi:hypothetical protein
LRAGWRSGGEGAGTRAAGGGGGNGVVTAGLPDWTTEQGSIKGRARARVGAVGLLVREGNGGLF